MKTPKVVKGKNIINVLIKNGYKVKNRKGSHVSLSNGKIHITVVLPFNDNRNIQQNSQINRDT